MFVAIELSTQARAEILSLQSSLESAAPDVFRFPAEESLHLTLYFLGDMEQSTTEDLISRLQAARFEPVELALGHIVKLPETNVPKVLAVSVQSAGLPSLQQRVHDLCFSLAEHKETRPYLAHVTFARLSPSVPASAKIVKRGVARLAQPESVRWTVDSICVLRSHLGPDGAVYERVATIAIGV